MKQKLPMYPMVGMILLAGLAGCHHAPDESLVRQGIEAAERSAEHADASSFGDVLSEDFDGNGGDVDRRQLLGLLRAAAFRGESVHALSGPIEAHKARQFDSLSARILRHVPAE